MLTGVAAAAALLPAGANAATSIVSGAACNHYWDTDAADVHEVSREDRIRNLETDHEVVVTCPVNRINPAVSISDFDVNAYTGNVAFFDDAFFCSLTARTVTGSIASIVNQENASQNANVTLDWPSVAAGSTLNYYSLFCDLPPGGRIYSYRWVE